MPPSNDEDEKFFSDEEGGLVDVNYADQITDYDLLALKRLIGRYGKNAVILWIRHLKDADMESALKMGEQFRQDYVHFRRSRQDG
jgi:hypothetical protein